jgi:hypothetical protein
MGGWVIGALSALVKWRAATTPRLVFAILPEGSHLERTTIDPADRIC